MIIMQEAVSQFHFVCCNVHHTNMMLAREVLTTDLDSCEPLKAVPEDRWVDILVGFSCQLCSSAPEPRVLAGLFWLQQHFVTTDACHLSTSKPLSVISNGIHGLYSVAGSTIITRVHVRENLSKRMEAAPIIALLACCSAMGLERTKLLLNFKLG